MLFLTKQRIFLETTPDQSRSAPSCCHGFDVNNTFGIIVLDFHDILENRRRTKKLHTTTRPQSGRFGDIITGDFTVPVV